VSKEFNPMTNEWIGKKLYIRISEPFEYGLEDNPIPLEAVVMHTFATGQDHYLVVRTQLTFKGVFYAIGALRSRYATELHLLAILEKRTFVVVGASFIPRGHPQEARMLEGDFELARSLDIVRQTPDPNLKDWANFIGSVSLVETLILMNGNNGVLFS
jgi:hypothetical protein